MSADLSSLSCNNLGVSEVQAVELSSLLIGESGETNETLDKLDGNGEMMVTRVTCPLQRVLELYSESRSMINSHS